MTSRGTPKGTTLSKAHRENMSIARRNSPKAKAHYERMREVMKGRHPKEATAARMANVALRKVGLTREQAPELFQGYFDLFLAEYEAAPA